MSRLYGQYDEMRMDVICHIIMSQDDRREISSVTFAIWILLDARQSR